MISRTSTDHLLPAQPVPEQQVQVTPKDLIEYLEANNCYDAVFPTWDRMDLMRAISQASQQRTLAFTSEEGKITGVCIARLCPNKIVHVIGIIVSNKASMANMLIHFNLNYPLHTLTGNRNGKLIHYDLEDLNLLYKTIKKQTSGSPRIITKEDE